MTPQKRRAEPARPRRPARPRGSLEPSSVGDVVAGLMRERVLAGGVKVGRLARQWPQVVGERMSAETAPVRLEAGTLVVAATDGPWGAQARFLAEEIRRQANQALGGEPVKRVQVVVDPGRSDGTSEARSSGRWRAGEEGRGTGGMEGPKTL